jgi:hypothetical protein
MSQLRSIAAITTPRERCAVDSRIKRKFALPRKVKLLSEIERDQFEAHGLTRHHLRKQRKVDARHVRNFRISAGRLAVRHQDNRIAVRRHLNRTERDALGNHFDRLAEREFRSLEPVAHTIRMGRHLESGLRERELRIVRKQWPLRPFDDANQLPSCGARAGAINTGRWRRRERSTRIEIREVFREIAFRFTDANHVAGAKRAPLETAEFATQICALAAHHLRNGIPAPHREVGPTTGATPAEFEHAARANADGPVHRHVTIADAWGQVASAERNDGFRFESERWPDQRDFQRRFGFAVADEQIGDAVRPLVHRTVDDDPVALVAQPPQILQCRQSARLDHANRHHRARHKASYCSRVIGTKRTSSPAASRQGGSVSGVNSRIGVRPITFHPPGVSSE